MTIWLSKLSEFRKEVKRLGWKSVTSRALASCGLDPDDNSPAVILIGRPLWFRIPERLGVSIESYTELAVIPHEIMHGVLLAIGETEASRAIDRRWPFGAVH